MVAALPPCSSKDAKKFAKEFPACDEPLISTISCKMLEEGSLLKARGHIYVTQSSIHFRASGIRHHGDIVEIKNSEVKSIGEGEKKVLDISTGDKTYHFSSISGDFAQVHLALREHMLVPGTTAAMPVSNVTPEVREKKKLGRGLILDQVKGFGKSTVSQGMAVLTHSTSQRGLSSQVKDTEKQRKRQSVSIQLPSTGESESSERDESEKSEKSCSSGDSATVKLTAEVSSGAKEETEEEKRKRRERRRERKERKERRKSCEVTEAIEPEPEDAEKKRERREKRKREKKERKEVEDGSSCTDEIPTRSAVQRNDSESVCDSEGDRTECELDGFSNRLSFDESERSEQQGISLAEYTRQQERDIENEKEREEESKSSGDTMGVEEDHELFSASDCVPTVEETGDSVRSPVSISVEDYAMGEKEKRPRSLSGGDKRPSGRLGSKLGRLRAGIDRKISTGSRIVHRDRSPATPAGDRRGSSPSPSIPPALSSISLEEGSAGEKSGEGTSGRRRNWLKSSVGSKFQFQAVSKQQGEGASAHKSQSTSGVSARGHRHSRSLDNEELEVIRQSHSTSDLPQSFSRPPLDERQGHSSITVGDGTLMREGLRNISGGVAVMGRIGAKLKEDIEMKRKQASASAKSLEAKASRKNPLNKLPIRRTQRGQGGLHVGKSSPVVLTQSMQDCRDGDDPYFGALYTMQLSVIEGQELNTSGAVGVYCSVTVTDAGTGEAFYVAKTNKAKELSWPDSVFETLVFFDRVLKVTVTVKAATTGPDLLLGSTYVLVDKPEAFASFDNWLPLLDPNTQTATKARGLIRLAVSMVRAVPAAVQQEQFVEKKAVTATQTAEQRESHQKSLTRMWETTMQGGSTSSSLREKLSSSRATASSALGITSTSPSSNSLSSPGGALPAGALASSPAPSSSGELSAKPRLIKALARPFSHRRSGSTAKRPPLEPSAGGSGDGGALAAYFYQSGDVKETFCLPKAMVDAELPGGAPVVIPYMRKFPALSLTKKLTLFPEDVARKHSEQVEGSGLKQPVPFSDDDNKFYLPSKSRKILQYIYMPPHASPPLKWKVPLLKRVRGDEDDSDDDQDSDEEGVPLEDMDGEGKALSKLAGFEKLNEEVSESGPAADFLETKKERIARLQEERIVKKNTRREINRTKKDMALAYSSLGLSHHNMNKMLLTFTSGASDWMAWRVRFNTAIGRGMEQLGIAVGEVQALEYPVHETWVYCQRKFGDARDETVLEKFQKVTRSHSEETEGENEDEEEDTKALKRTPGDKNLLHLLPSAPVLPRPAASAEGEVRSKNDDSGKEGESSGSVRRRENVTTTPEEGGASQREGGKESPAEADQRKLLLRQTTSGTLVKTRAGGHRSQLAHSEGEKSTKKETPEGPHPTVKKKGNAPPEKPSAWKASDSDRGKEGASSFSTTGGISRQRGTAGNSGHGRDTKKDTGSSVVLADAPLAAQPVEEQVVQLPHLIVGGILLVVLCLAYLFFL